MTPEQRVIVAWLRNVMRNKGISAERWAIMAGVAPTSITRAMRESYTGTSSMPLLHRLARAADVPSPLDFLAGRAEMPTEAELLAAIRGVLVIQENGVIDAELLAKAVSGLLNSATRAS